MTKLFNTILAIALLIHLYEWFLSPAPPENIARDTLIIAAAFAVSLIPYTRER
jgi:hypothetical protein